MVQKWRYLSFSRRDAFENMAVDEAILRENQRKKMLPTLRFYGWNMPSVSLGYFQDIKEEVNVDFCRKNNIHVVRRPTGGKAVLHGGDLTYSVVARENNPLFPGGLLGTYSVISGCIATGLHNLGIKADLIKEGRPTDDVHLKAVCFSSPSQYELLVNGRKICGSAQMRSKGVFLQHGSLIVDFDAHQTCLAIGKSGHDSAKEAEKLKKRVASVSQNSDKKPDWLGLCQILASGFEEFLGIRLVRGSLTPEEETLKEQLLQSKYSDRNWNLEGESS